MCHINDDFERDNKRGRPVNGLEGKSRYRNVRLEPYLDWELGNVCKQLGISKSEGIRQGVIAFIKQAKQALKER